MKNGISEQEARQRLEQFGPNELKDETSRSLPHIVLSALREPMVMLLVGIGGLYLFLGETHEVLSLLSFLLLILAITVFQEQKTEKTLSALKELSSPRVTVVRDGKQKSIPGREIVPGDLVFLSEGDRVPADIKLIEGGPLSLNEAILTGESFPSEKTPSRSNQSKIMSGSLVLRGQAWGEVIGTGNKTEIGRIGKVLKQDSERKTSLQKSTRAMVNKVGGLAAALTAFVILYYGLTRQEWIEAVLVGLTLAMAILPNELPAVLLIFLATGAWRISRRKVLTRKVPAVEALGGITILCADKTGTLTQNRMIIQSFWSHGKRIELSGLRTYELPEAFHEILEFGILASRPHPFDPMEIAFHSAGQNFLQKTEHLHPQWVLSKEYPITDQLLAVSYAWRKVNEDEYSIGAKGAPEAIIDLCHLSSSEIGIIEKQVSQMASQGLRVLGVAKAISKSLPPIQHDLDFQFMGLVGLDDPLRSDAKAAVAECLQAGIRVMMITGDHPETARAIGKQLGLKNNEVTLSGSEIEKMDDFMLIEHLKNVHIFCRMQPMQKYRIVTLLQASGEVVAMTGDGVNDAPALSKADIGIAMGERGTDVAREAASIVLLDDNFSSIVAAIRIGRQTYRNLQKAFSYLLAIHIPITAVSILPVVFKLPLVLLPVHIAFLHLIIEPVCTIVFEADSGEPELMHMPPRKADSSILTKTNIIECLIQGFWLMTVVMGVFAFSIWRGHTPEDVRGLTFTTLILSNLALIYSYHVRKNSKKNNMPIVFMTFATFFLLTIVLYVPLLRKMFLFEFLHPVDLALCLLAGSITALPLLIYSVISKLFRKAF